VRSSKQVTLSSATLWNVAAPYLYTVSSTLTSGSGTRDTVNVTIGIRNAYFDANYGFILNGFPIKIQGFSQHQVGVSLLFGLRGAAFSCPTVGCAHCRTSRALELLSLIALTGTVWMR
jgi:hypothetical protein